MAYMGGKAAFHAASRLLKQKAGFMGKVPAFGAECRLLRAEIRLLWPESLFSRNISSFCGRKPDYLGVKPAFEALRRLLK